MKTLTQYLQVGTWTKQLFKINKQETDKKIPTDEKKEISNELFLVKKLDGRGGVGEEVTGGGEEEV